MHLIRLLIIIGFLGVVSPTFARTWYVEKDGSGDFTVIQDAADAADDGDVIQIGPGLFDDYTTHSFGTANIILDGQKSLTFIGSGSGVTLIGPEQYAGEPNSFGFGCLSGPATVRIENLMVANYNARGIDMYNANFEMSDCIIENCYKGVGLFTVNASIENCQFLNGPLATSSSAMWCRSPHLLVRNVEVHNYVSGINFDYSGSTDVLITDCLFDGGEFGYVGSRATFGAGGTIENCYFTNWRNYAFVAGGSGTIIFRNNVVENCNGDGPGNGVGFEGCENLTMHDNIISNCNKCIFVGQANGQELIFNNHFFRKPGDGYFVKCLSYWPYGPDYVNLGNNYWGTTNTDEIDQWIFDGNDDPLVEMFINYMPLADGPVSTEKKTLDGVKALYR